jgi:AcrR family transcriptional regulator
LTLNTATALVAAGATLSGLSLVTIAEHAGVSRNSLYRRWKTKDDLYLDVLDTINKPQPEFAGQAAREAMAAHLATIIERTPDKWASSMLRAPLAEAGTFPELHRRYFEQIVAPRREVMYGIIRRGITAGEIRRDADPALINEVLVGPSWPGWEAATPTASIPSRPAAGSPISSTRASSPAERRSRRPGVGG